jgi:hypothetical protein
MTRVEKIEDEIRALTPAERSALRAWFQAYESDLWDKQIEADAAAGKLDRLGERALAEHRKGKSKPL